MIQSILNVIPPLAFVMCVLLHAADEFKNGLATYLEKIVGFAVEKWLNWVLLALAVLIILFPFALVITGVLPENLAKSFVVGALLGDAFSTHWIPSIKWRWSPGSLSALLYPYMAFLLWQSTIGFDPFAATLGALAFIILWPALYGIKKGIELGEYIKHQD